MLRRIIDGLKVVGFELNYVLLCLVIGAGICVFTLHTECSSAAPMAEKVTHVNFSHAFPNSG